MSLSSEEGYLLINLTSETVSALEDFRISALSQSPSPLPDTDAEKNEIDVSQLN